MSETNLFDGEDGQDAQFENQGQKKGEQDSVVAARYRISPLSLTVFKRENDSGVFYNLQLQRKYTVDDGYSFEYTEGLRPRDLRKASRLLDKAADDLQGLEVTSP